MAMYLIQDTVRQRNSVSGRMTLRRPSLNSESPKWEVEKLNRTEFVTYLFIQIIYSNLNILNF
jgi:hypothetical protein